MNPSTEGAGKFCEALPAAEKASRIWRSGRKIKRLAQIFRAPQEGTSFMLKRRQWRMKRGGNGAAVGKTERQRQFFRTPQEGRQQSLFLRQK